MSDVQEVTEQLDNLNVEENKEEIVIPAEVKNEEIVLPTLPDDKIETLFNKITAIRQVAKAAIVSENKIYNSNIELTVEEIESFPQIFADHDTAFSKGINLAGVRYEVHRFHPENGLIYGRRGKGDKNSVGVVLVRSFANVYVVATYGYPHLSARVIPQVRKEIAEILN